MANAKAQSEKEKGNTAFQARDYPTAIGHYSAAILADRNDHTFPLNRAAAYLKLGKNEDAERDCTTVLNLSAYNVKALFRRAQARIGMGRLEDALSDLRQASNRDPANESVKDELKRVEELLQTHKKKTPKLPAEAPLSTTPTARRRVPIKIIEPPAKTDSSTRESLAKSQSQETSPSIISEKSQVNTSDSLTPVSTRSLKPTHPSHTQVRQAQNPSYADSSKPSKTTIPTQTEPAKPEQPRSFKEAKQARDNVKPSRVGGGIFRPSGDNTIFPVKSGIANGSAPNGRESSATPQSATHFSSEKEKGRAGGIQALLPVKSPATLFDFARAWDLASSLAERWGLILSVPSANIPALFKTSLEPALLIGIVSVFGDVLAASRDVVGTVSEYMDAFARVQRFETVVMFLSRQEKAMVRRCWEALGRGKEDTGKAWGSVWG